MLPHQAFRDEHSQPVVLTAKYLYEEIPIITAQVTKELMFWDTGPDYDRAAYKYLSRNGFQNEDYKWTVQMACLYTEYLIRTKRATIRDAVVTASAKATDFALAMYHHHNLKSFKVMPSNIEQKMYNLLKELPEFSKQIGLSIVDSEYNKGALKMSNMNTLINVQTPNGIVSMTVQQALASGVQLPPQLLQQMQMQVPQQQYVTGQPQFQQQQYQGQQYQGQQYVQGGGLTPAQIQEQKWQVLNATRQAQQMTNQYNQQQQQPAANMMGQMAAGNVMGTYQQYNQQQQMQMPGAPADTNAGVGGTLSTGTTAPVQPPTVTKATTTPSQWWGSDVPEEPQVEPPVAQVIVESVVLEQTATGYLYPYSYPTRVDMNSGLDLEQASMYPVVFDSDIYSGYWMLNRNKLVIGFTVKENDVMDYDKHDVAQYFSRQRKAASTIDKKKTIKLLADVQKKAFIAQRLDEIEPETEVEGNVTPAEDAYVFGDPIEIPRLMLGETTTYDYCIRLLMVDELSEQMQDAIQLSVVNYEHQYMQPLVLGHPYAETLLDLKKSKRYSDILEIMDGLADLDSAEYCWQYINRTTTEFINKLLKYRYKLTIEIQSFYLDYEDLVEYLDDNHGFATAFNETAVELLQSALYPYSKDDEVFDETWSDTDTSTVSFGILSDVTILPILSDEINIPVPVPTDADTAELKLRHTAVVTNKSYPELYRAIKHRVTNADPRASRIAFGTKDGEFFFVQKTLKDTAYIITRQP